MKVLSDTRSAVPPGVRLTIDRRAVQGVAGPNVEPPSEISTLGAKVEPPSSEAVKRTSHPMLSG